MHSRQSLRRELASAQDQPTSTEELRSAPVSANESALHHLELREVQRFESAPKRDLVAPISPSHNDILTEQHLATATLLEEANAKQIKRVEWLSARQARATTPFVQQDLERSIATSELTLQTNLNHLEHTMNSISKSFSTSIHSLRATEQARSILAQSSRVTDLLKAFAQLLVVESTPVSLVEIDHLLGRVPLSASTSISSAGGLDLDETNLSDDELRTILAQELNLENTARLEAQRASQRFSLDQAMHAQSLAEISRSSGRLAELRSYVEPDLAVLLNLVRALQQSYEASKELLDLLGLATQLLERVEVPRFSVTVLLETNGSRTTPNEQDQLRTFDSLASRAIQDFNQLEIAVQQAEQQFVDRIALSPLVSNLTAARQLDAVINLYSSSISSPPLPQSNQDLLLKAKLQEKLAKKLLLVAAAGEVELKKGKETLQRLKTLVFQED